MNARDVGPEQPVGQDLHGLRGGPLAHPDQHRAVAEHQHVAALDRGRAGLRAVIPEREVTAGEHRVPPVHGLVADRFPHPGGHPHGVHRHPAVDPARGVPLVEQVRQRGEHEPVGQQRVERDALRLGDQLQDLPLGDAADQEAGQLGRVHALQRAAQRAGRQRAVPQRVEHLVKHVLPGLRDLHGLGQQVAVVVHGDAAVAQRLGEPVVLRLRLGHPEHVVEQQLGGVVRGEALQLQAGAVQDDLAQAANFRGDVEHGTHLPGRPRS
jgi:hypothetical protein